MTESMSKKIKVDSKVMNDLNEFLIQTFRDAAEISDSEDVQDSRKQSISINPEVKDVDAFDYVNQEQVTKSPKKKRAKKLSKT